MSAPKLVLGVTGSIASYRAADLARDLMRSGFDVHVCMSDAAQEFLSPLVFATLTGNPCLTSTFEEPVKGRMAHIDLAREAGMVLVAPATANTLNRMAAGITEDMLTTLFLAFEGPVIIAPAMNPAMYAHPATLAAIETLRQRGALIVEPTEGDVVSGEVGLGKLASNDRIVATTSEVSARSKLLAGQRVLITSGPTQEPLDDVRYLSNHSSGKMGAALASAALLLGAEVTVVSGPVAVAYPRHANVIRVSTALEMLNAAQGVGADWIIGAAAVADFRPTQRVDGKIRRSGEGLQISLTPNPDIIATLAAATKAKVVGFAAEPSPDMSVAREKLARKNLFAIVANDISRSDIGFGADFNELQVLFADGRIESSGKQSKLACAIWLLEQLCRQSG